MWLPLQVAAGGYLAGYRTCGPDPNGLLTWAGEPLKDQCR